MKKHVLKDRYDVVIIGSGPAGAATAQALSGQGLDVVILEKQQIPRHKMCSGILFPNAMNMVSEHFGDIPKRVCCDPVQIKGNRLFLTNESPLLEWPFLVRGRATEGMNINRSEFDAWLCGSSGAAISDQCRFIGLEDQGGEILLKVQQDREESEIVTNYLVGADGTLSRVRKALVPAFDQGIGLLPNYEEWYVGEIDLEPQWLYQFFDRKVTGFFACVFHKDNQIIVTTGCQAKEAVKGLFQAFVTHLKQRHGLKIQEIRERYACVIHDMSGTNNYFPGQGNVLLVGEAAGLNRCAEGITSALISGKAAGNAILQGAGTRQPIDFYVKTVNLEMEKCNKAIQVVEKAIGFNPFTRE